MFGKGSIRSQKKIETLFGWLFTLPFLLVFLGFLVYPMIYSFYLSFFEYSGFTPPSYIGLNNYIQLIFSDPVFPKTVFNTWYIWLCCFIFQLLSAFALAPILSYAKIKGVPMWRSFFYFPNLVSSAVMAVVFLSFLGRDTGTINLFLTQTGIIEKPINFLGTSVLAQGVVSFIIWLQYFGVFIIYISSAIAAVPADLYEAAKLDGCKPSRAYFSITLPLLRPVIFYILITSLAGGMQIFEQPFFISKGTGAPDSNLLSMVMYLYRMAFNLNRMGYGSAIGILVFLMILVGTIILVSVNSHFKKKYI